MEYQWITHNPWHKLCLDLIPLAERPSQEKFLKSVKRQIEISQEMYPTVAQKQILARLRKHLLVSQAERDAQEYAGMSA